MVNGTSLHRVEAPTQGPSISNTNRSIDILTLGVHTVCTVCLHNEP